MYESSTISCIFQAKGLANDDDDVDNGTGGDESTKFDEDRNMSVMLHVSLGDPKIWS